MSRMSWRVLRTELLRGAAPALAVTLGSLGALLFIVVPSAALVSRVASYSGGGWQWIVAATVPAVAVLSAIGAAVGRVVAFRITAPVVGVVMFILLTTTLAEGDHVWLSPIMDEWAPAPDSALPDVVSAQQSLLFVGVTGIAIVLAAARRKVWAAFPGAVAIGVAFPLLAALP